MYYWTVKKMDTANGPWLRVSLFVSGCPHECPWCFNAVAWNFKYGQEYTQEVIDEILEELSSSYITWITFLWGEPLAPENQEQVWNTIRQIKEKYPNKSIWCFSWYQYEFITKYMVPNLPYTHDIISNLDVLVDWRFEQDLMDLKLKFRGSRNQRVIDIPATLKQWEVVWSNAVDDKDMYVYRPFLQEEKFKEDVIFYWETLKNMTIPWNSSLLSRLELFKQKVLYILQQNKNGTL